MDKKEIFTANGSVMVDGIEVATYGRVITSCNELGVEVGTTGLMGGDTGHGGRTYFKVYDSSCSDMRCHAVGYSAAERRYVDVEINNARSVELIFGGDTELDTFCAALRIGYEVLSRESAGVDYWEPSAMELRQERFALYVNELCAHYRKTRGLKGMSDIRAKYHVTGLTQQQFFECDLHRDTGYVERSFCDKVYAFILDTTKAIPAPKYEG